MITSGSDMHDFVANLLFEVESDLRRDVMVEILAAIHHLADQYEIEYPDLLEAGSFLYQNQIDREMKAFVDGADLDDRPEDSCQP